MQCHSLAVGHRNYMMSLPFTKCQCHLLPVGHKKRCNETGFHKMCDVTHKLLVIGRDSLSWTVQCHSQAVGHGKRSDETAFHNLPKCAMSLTPCHWLYKKM